MGRSVTSAVWGICLPKLVVEKGSLVILSTFVWPGIVYKARRSVFYELNALFVCVQVCVYIYMYVCVYTCTHTQVYVLLSRKEEVTSSDCMF